MGQSGAAITLSLSRVKWEGERIPQQRKRLGEKWAVGSWQASVQLEGGREARRAGKGGEREASGVLALKRNFPELRLPPSPSPQKHIATQVGN